MTHKNSNQDFIPGASLVTNLEEYAMKVQKEADDYSLKVRTEADAYKKEIEASLNDAVTKKLNAEDENARILAKTKEQAEEIQKRAYQEGFEQGHKEALAKYKEELETTLKNIKNITQELAKHKEKLVENYEQILLKICLLMARVIVKSELTTREDLILGVLKRVLKKTQDLGKIRILLHPVDIDFVKEHSAELKKLLEETQGLQLQADEKITPGGVMIDTDFAKIDLDLAEQFKKLDAFFLDSLEGRKLAFQKNQSGERES